MWSNIWNNINKWFNDVTNDVKAFFVDNSRNPILWIVIIIIGLAIFEFVYKSLNKD